MSAIDYVDLHEAKIKSITMEAPEGYEFGHIVKAEIEMRVASYVISSDKEGNIVRTAVLVMEGCHIKESYDPSAQFTNGGAAGSLVSPDDDDDDEDDDGPVSASGDPVDPETGEINPNVDPEVGF